MVYLKEKYSCSHYIFAPVACVLEYSQRLPFPVEINRRGIADFFGLILLKRRRIAGKCPLYMRDKAAEWAGTAVFGLYKHMYI